MLCHSSRTAPSPLTPSPCQREVVVSRPSFNAAAADASGSSSGSTKLAEALSEAFIALEEQMKDPATRPELYSLSRGERGELFMGPACFS